MYVMKFSVTIKAEEENGWGAQSCCQCSEFSFLRKELFELWLEIKKKCSSNNKIYKLRPESWLPQGGLSINTVLRQQCCHKVFVHFVWWLMNSYLESCRQFKHIGHVEIHNDTRFLLCSELCVFGFLQTDPELYCKSGL